MMSNHHHHIRHGVTRRSPAIIVDASADERELELEIITPVTYPQSPGESFDKEDASISDAESDIDMSFDLDDDDDDSDDDDTDSDAEDEGDVDVDILGVHESILDVPPVVAEEPSGHDTVSDDRDARSVLSSPPIPPPPPTPIAIPSPPIAMPSAPPSSWPPRLPCLSSIPAYCLREYPQMTLLGTPAQNSPFARGSLLPQQPERCCRRFATAVAGGCLVL